MIPLLMEFINGLLTTSDRILKTEVGVEIFLGGGLREEVGGVEHLLDLGLKKRWGVEFCHQLY